MARKIQFPMYEDPPILAADIGVYQSNQNTTPVTHFDFEAYQARGMRALKLRGGVAAAGLDYEFGYNLNECQQRKIWVPDVYHYTKLWKSLDAQAAVAWDTYQLAKEYSVFLGFLALDIEENDDLSKTQFTGNAEKLVSRLIGKGVPEDRLGIYTGAYVWEKFTYRNDWAKHLWLWIAHWFPGVNLFKLPTFRPYLPDDWAGITNPDIEHDLRWWQVDVPYVGFEFGSRGDDQIDMNWFTYQGGTRAAWKSLYGVDYGEATLPPDPDPAPGFEAYQAMVNLPLTGSLNFRDAANLAPEVRVGALYGGQEVRVVAETLVSGVNWCQVELEEGPYWMSKRYLLKVEG